MRTRHEEQVPLEEEFRVLWGNFKQFFLTEGIGIQWGVIGIVGNYLVSLFFYCSLNTRKLSVSKSRLATQKSVSTKRKFSFQTNTRIEELKRIKLKKQSEAKVKWAVNAYNDWRNEHLYNYQYDYAIYKADLNKLEKLEKANLQHTLCHFIPEVTKVKGEGLYPGKTLYQMVVAIQKYLKINKIFWKLVDGSEF